MMAWTILYAVAGEGNLAMRCTSYHDAAEAHKDIVTKIISRWGTDVDFKITCMVKGTHEVWLADEVRYV